MKYIVVLGDGMADYPIPQLGNKTPLQSANKPNIDNLAKHSEMGMVQTIPNGVAPASDTANLSVMGYNPKIFYTGRSPLEAISMGINLSETDVALRCNLVTLSNESNYSDKTMLDYSSDEISSEEASALILEINKHFMNDEFKFHAGISYRHCLVWNKGHTNLMLTPPHDILERKIHKYLPEGINNKKLLELMIKSNTFLNEHPINKSRISRGLKPANSIWLWGEGKKPALESFKEKYNLTGSVIAAVDLIKGIGICAGLKSVNVNGATGNIDTDFVGKAKAALNELDSGSDFVYIHVEAPDECGHRYEINNKVKAIELIDEKVVGTLLKGLDKFGDYKILILPDHPTPLALRTHTPEPVPYMIYQKSIDTESSVSGYDEFQAKKTGVFIQEGYKLMDSFLLK